MTLYTDNLDYAPGETAKITGLVSVGGRLLLQVSHIDLPGPDGIYGTADDVLDSILNAGKADHQAIAVTDGGAGDADGVANGEIVFEWYVNPDDSLGERFLVSAQEIGAGPDGTFDTDDDAPTGPATYTTFTDSLAPPIQTFYVPLAEADLLTSFQAIDSDAAGPINTSIGITNAIANTIIYYDHWEDGYEADITNPIQSSTEIWGDGDVSNGAAPGVTDDADDIFLGGESIVLRNAIDPSATPTEPYDYDGGDLIQSSFPIAVVRAAYPADPGSVLAGAVEVASTNDWGTSFLVPVGEDTPTSGTTIPFEYTAAYVMAESDGTEIFLNGVSQGFLGQGESTVIRVDEGDRITSSASVQVNLVTGDIGSEWEMRWYSLTPDDDWTNDYYAPFAEEHGPTGFWFYNDNDTEITINYEGADVTNGSFDVDANSSRFIEIGDDIDISDNTGLHFYTDSSTDVFYVIAQIDANFEDNDGINDGGERFDWGYPLIPSNQLTSQAVVGLGRGNSRDDTSETASYSIVWVSPVETADILVDFDGDGTVDYTFEDVAALDVVEIFDDTDVFPNAEDDQDMSGAVITAFNNNGDPVNIAVAYGQKPQEDGAESDKLDFGTVVKPLPDIAAQKNASLFVDHDGDGKFDPGDQIQYTITVLNISPVDIAAGGYSVIDLIDQNQLLDNVTYVPGSTTFTYVNDSDVEVTEAIADDADGPSGLPIDEDYLSTDEISGNKDADGYAGEAHTYTFRVEINDFEDLLPGTTHLTNTGELRIGGEKLYDLIATVPLDFEATIGIEKYTNGEDADDPTGPQIAEGDPVTWTYVVTNEGNVLLSNIVVSDDNGTPGDSNDDITPVLLDVDINEGTGDLDGDGILDFNETWIYEATGVAQVGQYGNIGTATGDGVYSDKSVIEGIDQATASDPSHYQGTERAPTPPSLAIAKEVLDVDGEGPDGVVDRAGDVIKYKITVTNDGQIDLTNVWIEDPLTNTLQNVGDLAIGESTSIEATYIASQDDLDENGIDHLGAGDNDGDIDNQASAWSDQTPDPVQAVEDVDIELGPCIDIDKQIVGVDVDGDGLLNAVGDEVDYKIEVFNPGNVSLTNVVVTDPLLGGVLANPVNAAGGDLDEDGELDVGEVWVYSGTYVLTQDDLDGEGYADEDGNLENTASAESTETGPVYDTEDVPIEGLSSYVMDKIVVDVGGDGADGIVDEAGDVITYQVLVTNTGKANISGVTLTDPLLTGPNGTLNAVVESLNADGVLEVGEVWTYEGTYTVQQEDLDSQGDTADGEGEDGDIANTAIITVDGLPPQADCEKVSIEYNPHATFDKRVVDVGNKGPNGHADVGDIITYELVAFNDGNITYDDAIIHDWWLEGDPNATFGEVVETGGTGTNGDGILDVGETWTVIATYEVQQSDVDSNGGGDGDIDNTAFLWIPTGDVFDHESVPVQYLPSIKIDKKVTGVSGSGYDDVVVNPGDVISYEIVVRNTGNVTATEVMIKDELLTGPHGTMSTPVETGGTGTNGDGILDPGETWTVTGTYTAQAEDFHTNGGGDRDIDNTAIAWTNILPDVVDSASVEIASGVTIYGTKKGETINGFQTASGQPVATAFNDVIYGRKGKDKIDGEAGNDWISGQQGKDKLTGGAGYDSFVFDQKAGKKHADKITDFNGDFDKIVIDESKFKKLKLGDLDSQYFHIGKKAKDKSDFIIYDKKKGTVGYDADGSKGKHDVEVFAKVGKVDLGADDFFVF